MTFRLPLSGIRVLELTTAWAGPYACRLLADMGAEVIKIESAKHWDIGRSFAAELSSLDHPWDRAPYFNALNRNKYSLSLDLATDEGHDIFLRLVEVSDLVVENLRPGAMDNLRLDYDTLSARNPQLIVVSMPAHGLSGPERDYPAYGTNVEQLSGLVSLTGYEDGPPHKTGLSYGDPVAGAAGAAAIGIALWDLRRTGRGQRIEVPQRETLTTLIGEEIAGHSLGYTEHPRRGNRHPTIAPHGVFPCAPIARAVPEARVPAQDTSPWPSANAQPSDRDPDAWIAIACPDDATFAALRRVAVLPPDPRFADAVSRKRHEDALDELISAWTRERTPLGAAEILQTAGVPASPVFSVTDILHDTHLRDRGVFEPVSHPTAGIMDIESPHWRLSETPAHIRLPAPTFARHNAYALRDLLGLTDEEIATLTAKNITPAAPDWSVHE